MASLALLHSIVDHHIVHHDHQVGFPLPSSEETAGSAARVGDSQLVIVTGGQLLGDVIDRRAALAPGGELAERFLAAAFYLY